MIVMGIVSKRIYSLSKLRISALIWNESEKQVWNLMRILINGTNYYPEKIGIGKYSGEMAEWLVAHGHKVRVVTAPHYYPQWRVADPNRWR